MPVKDGIAAVQEITNLQPVILILILQNYPSDYKVFLAVKAGAMDHFLKETRSEQLIDAIRMVYRGTAFLQPETAQKLMAEIRRPFKPLIRVFPDCLKMDL